MTMKRLFCSSLAVICVATSFASCGSKKEKKDDFLGKWECEKIVMGGEEMDNFFGIDAYAIYQIELKEGNKGTVDSAFSTEGKPVDLTWEKQDDGKIKLVNDEAFDGEEAILEKSGSKMIMSVADDDEDDEEGESEEVKMYFVKVDSFKEMPENPFGDFGSDDDDADEDDADEADDE